MPSFRQSIEVIILLFLLHSGSIQADAKCQIQSVDAGSISPRTRMVIFPDGRRITVVGHNHGSRSFPDRFSRINMQSVEQLSNQDYIHELNLLKADAASAIRDAREEFEFLNDILNTDHRIQFIGAEATDPIVKNNIAGYAVMYERFESTLKRRDIKLDPELNDLVIAIISPSYYLQIRHPERLKGIEIAGFESAEATQAFSKALAAVDVTRAHLDKLAKADRHFLSEVGSTSLQLDAFYPKYNPEVDHAKIIKNIEIDKVPAPYREATMAWLEARLDEFDARKWRDSAVVEGMVSRGESGILFVGSAHRESIDLLLEKACLAELRFSNH